MQAFQPLFARIFKFCITGGIGMMVDFSITAISKEYFGINPYVANLMGILTALVLIFMLHKSWTFADNDKNISKQFQLFLIISLLGCLWNSGFLYLLQQYFALSFYVAKALAIILVGAWNFSANYMITFKANPGFSES